MARKHRCLIIESLYYETGFAMEQLQIPLRLATNFFGRGNRRIDIAVNVFLDPTQAQPTFTKNISISKEYKNGTRRINGLPEIAQMSDAFIFIEETNQNRLYNIWFSLDKAIVAARFNGWEQGRNSQHGRGRLAKIVNAPVPRVITRV